MTVLEYLRGLDFQPMETFPWSDGIPQGIVLRPKDRQVGPSIYGGDLSGLTTPGCGCCSDSYNLGSLRSENDGWAWLSPEVTSA